MVLDCSKLENLYLIIPTCLLLLYNYNNPKIKIFIDLYYIVMIVLCKDCIIICYELSNKLKLK